jgi:hypothetical protein
MWPGDWRKQKDKLNAKLREENKTGKYQRVMQEADDDEWWNFWGIIFSATVFGVGGVENLYDKSKEAVKEWTQVDLTDIMKKYRFEQLLRFIPFAMSGDDTSDPWNAIQGIVDGFNANRNHRMAASHIKVFDESMSPWNPTTTKTGGLPFLSFIMRKPKPLGTEFKVACCGETGECIHWFYRNDIHTCRLMLFTCLLQVFCCLSKYKKGKYQCKR